MTAGLTNLITLKRHLLNSSLISDTKFDTVIANIGLGVGGIFDLLTNRRLGYLAGDTVTFSADRSHFYLPRYPIVSLTTWEEKDDEATGWVTISSPVENADYATGWVYLGVDIATAVSQIRCTWTGGYWFDTTEDDTGVQPAGSTALPHELKYAFLTQCEHVWGQRDKLGLSLADKADNRYSAGRIGMADIVPLAQATINAYRRFQVL